MTVRRCTPEATKNASDRFDARLNDIRVGLVDRRLRKREQRRRGRALSFAELAKARAEMRGMRAW